MTTASIIIPCYNEGSTLSVCIDRIQKIADKNLSIEIIIVDDGSSDGSKEIAENLSRSHKNIEALFHDNNQGKGAALRTGFKKAAGEIVAVQDADLEYDPEDLKKLITLIREDKADVVIGSRFLTGGEHRVLYFWHSLGNRFLTFMSNMLTDLNLSDMESCYKVFRKDIIQGIEIQENRFGFEPEIIAKISKKRPRVYEMGISYSGRTYEEGKKINAKDGFWALYCILRYNACNAPFPLQFFCYLPLLILSSLCGAAVFALLNHFQFEFLATTIPAFVVFAAIQSLATNFLIFPSHDFESPLILSVFHTVIIGIALAIDLAVISLCRDSAPPGLSAVLAGYLVASLWLYVSYRFVFNTRPPKGD
jgi:glycosyltransferase involved in cell wall biosynthesis